VVAGIRLGMGHNEALGELVAAILLYLGSHANALVIAVGAGKKK